MGAWAVRRRYGGMGCKEVQAQTKRVHVFPFGICFIHLVISFSARVYCCPQRHHNQL